MTDLDCNICNQRITSFRNYLSIVQYDISTSEILMFVTHSSILQEVTLKLIFNQRSKLRLSSIMLIDFVLL